MYYNIDMKTNMMKIFALVVRVIVLGTLAMMIFSLREENAKLKSEIAALKISRTAHGDWCCESCVKGTNERALEHLEYMLEQNRRELEETTDEVSRGTILEIISGIEAHIDYIKSGRR